MSPLSRAVWAPPFPRFALIDQPSPLQRLPRFSAAVGGAEVWIKREDLLPLAFGGNKLRNLEFLVGAALAEDADHLVTGGRRWSNHARLTAAAGARAGLGVDLVLTGPRPAVAGPSATLAERFGARVRYTAGPDRDERAAAIDRIVAELRAAGRRPYRIDIGGSGVVGASGQVMAGLEVATQLAEAGVEPDELVLPTATGGTQAGLLVGLRLAGLRTRVVGVAVAGPADLVRSDVARLVDGLRGLIGRGPAMEPADLVVDGSQIGGGYGHRSAAAEAAAGLLATTEGILVDPIYTAKALAALIARARPGAFAGRPVLFWHAGGTPGLFERLESD